MRAGLALLASALIAPPDEREFPAEGAAWPRFEGLLARAGFTSRPDSLAAGTLGLLLAWLLLLAAYAATCWLTAKSVQGHSMPMPMPKLTPTSIARVYALTFIPIAVGYNVAHNFSSLVEQGQNLLFLASDPFGWHWDLFGSARLHTRSGLVDARITWSVAIAMVLLMLVFTALSLFVITDPMVRYTPAAHPG